MSETTEISWCKEVLLSPKSILPNKSRTASLQAPNGMWRRRKIPEILPTFVEPTSISIIVLEKWAYPWVSFSDGIY